MSSFDLGPVAKLLFTVMAFAAHSSTAFPQPLVMQRDRRPAIQEAPSRPLASIRSESNS
jgi:hypothetical protein